jgi:hypothetical protein
LRREAEALVDRPAASWWGALLVIVFWAVIVGALAAIFLPALMARPEPGANA